MRSHHYPACQHGVDCQSDHWDEGEERHSSGNWSARRFLEARACCAASSRILWQLWVCSFLRLTNSSPHALHTGDGKRTTERPSVRAVNPCSKARSVEPTRTCTAMTAASRKHQSLRLLREYHLLSQRPISSMRKPNGKSMPRHESVTTSLQTSSTSEKVLALVAGPPQPDGVRPGGASDSWHRWKDCTHIHHPHPLCDAPTPSVLSFFLSTGCIPLFPDRTHERRQFFRLVGWM